MSVTRRDCLALAGLGLLSPSFALADDRWAPRRLNPSERGMMERFLRRLSLHVPEIARDAEFLGDHVRIRLGEDRLFRTGSAALSQDGVRLLTLIAEMMMIFRVRMEAVAHHHSDGQSFRSFIISERRATAVTAAMESRQVRRDLLLATGLGENFPIATNATELGRATNRRVELIFRPA